MTYVMSDIHGCYDKYTEMLQRIRFSENDTLYILGDVIDRGPDGFKILLDLAQCPNVVCLMGNHEAMALDALSCIMCAVQRGKDAPLSQKEADAVDLWFGNGGEISLVDFLSLNEEQIQIVWDYMKNLSLYKEVSVGGKQFVLVHGGLGNFAENRPLEDYEPEELLWHRPKQDTIYYKDKYTIFGHTPVQLLRGLENPAKIYRHQNIIDIDYGCVYQGGQLGCLCLNTLEEFYVSERELYRSA